MEKNINETNDANIEKILWLAREIDRGNDSARPALREALQEDRELFLELGNIRGQYKDRLIRNFTNDSLEQEAIGAWMDQEARNLAGENATPIEILLALRITMDGFHLTKIEATVLDNYHPQPEWDLRRVESAHKRYLAGLKALSQARKFLSHDARGKNRKPRQRATAKAGISYKHSGHVTNGNGNGSVAIPEHANNS